MDEKVLENNEVIEETTDVVTTESGHGLAIAAGVGITALVGALLGKYVILPAVAKHKARKQEEVVVDAEDVDDEVFEEEDVEEDSEKK